MFKKIILDGETTRWSINENGDVRNDETGKFLKGTILHTYRYINFRWNRKQKNKAVHRLVAETFLPNPDNLPCVHHIDGNRMNNRLENLKWVMEAENSHETKSHRKREEHYQGKIEGEEWRQFRDTIYEVSTKGRVKNSNTGYITFGSLADCGYRRFEVRFSDGRHKHFLVHRMVYETFVSSEYEVINHINGNKTDNRVENLENVSHKENMKKAAEETNAWNFRKVAQYDKEGNLIKIYLNASDAGRAMGILPSSMRNAIRLRDGCHNGYIFKYIGNDETSTDYPKGVE